MAFTFLDLQSEVKRRATKNQGGTQFDTGIKNVINTSMWRIAREAKWRSLRRETFFRTIRNYTVGTGAVTVNTNTTTVTVGGATLVTDGIRVGRLVNLPGSNKTFKIITVSGETTFSIDQVSDGTNTTTGAYSILGQGEYVLPIQVGHSAFLWHREYGYPFQMTYVPTQEFFSDGVDDTTENIPIAYKMWGVDSALAQPRADSAVTISSSVSTDTSIAVTVFGTVAGYPDYEIINTNSSNGTTASAGSKLFTYIERITKNQSTTGRITCTTNSAPTVTVAVLPVGATTTGPLYTKVQVYPLPNAVIPIQVYYYKLPFQLINDGDVPELGEQFSEAIILLSTSKLKAEQNQKESVDFMGLYQDEIRSLKNTNVDKIDFFPKLKRPYGTLGDFTGGLRDSQIGNSGLYGPSSRY